MKLVQSLQNPSEDSEEGDNDEHASPREGEVNSHELSDAFEKELCELWDMSMNAVSNRRSNDSK